MAKTKNLGDVIRKWLAEDSALAEAVEREAVNARIARQIYQQRIDAGLTQEQLGDLAGMHQSVIARLEDAEYDGHSLSTLRRIASALGCDLDVEFNKKQHPQPGEFLTRHFESVVDWPEQISGSTATGQSERWPATIRFPAA